MKLKQWAERHEECMKRSVRTFLQAAGGVFITAIGSGEYQVTDWKTWIMTLIGSAISAGIAAVMNRKEDNRKED